MTDTWHIIDNAACGPESQAYFFSDDPNHQDRAMQICLKCPVREACFEEYFLDSDCVVGGTTWPQRIKMLKDDTYPDKARQRLDGIVQSYGPQVRLVAMGLPETVIGTLLGRHGVSYE